MYIHERDNWPNFTWDAEQLAKPLASVRHQQGQLLGRMSTLGFDVQADASLEMLTGEIITSSAIEGEALPLDQVRSSLAQRLGIDIGGLAPVDRHVEGIVEMMLDATGKAEQALTKSRLCAWQSALFPTGRSGLREVTLGRWRDEASGPMQVVSGPHGREQVHFEAPAAKRLEKEMKQFFTWFNGPAATLDPILMAAIAHFWFVTVHPFEDGNGRIARAIADLCLARADGIQERYYSMSSSIAKSRKAYYEILERSQKGELDITPWLLWFLECLASAIVSAEETLKNVRHKAQIWQRLSQHPINDRQRKVINKLLSGFEGKLTTSKYAKITKCSQDTALRDIQALIAFGVMAQEEGSGRSTSYRLI